jgi:hypothetical protein
VVGFTRRPHVVSGEQIRRAGAAWRACRDRGEGNRPGARAADRPDVLHRIEPSRHAIVGVPDYTHGDTSESAGVQTDERPVAGSFARRHGLGDAHAARMMGGSRLITHR